MEDIVLNTMDSKKVGKYIATFGRKLVNRLPYITHEICDVFISIIHCSICWDEKNDWWLKEMAIEE